MQVSCCAKNAIVRESWRRFDAEAEMHRTYCYISLLKMNNKARRHFVSRNCCGWCGFPTATPPGRSQKYRHLIFFFFFKENYCLERAYLLFRQGKDLEGEVGVITASKE